MNGLHDCGGMQGFGPIGHVADEPMFHSPWEGRVCAMSRSVGLAGKTRVTLGLRWGIEAIPAVDQVRMTYFEKWFASLVNRLVECGIVSPEEVARGQSDPDKRMISTPASVAQAIRANLGRPDGSTNTAAKPNFEVGDPVRVRNINPVTHTRCPRYLRSRTGIVVKHRGAWDFPDTAHITLAISDRHSPLPAEPDHVYAIRFPAREVWGDDAPPTDFLYADLWERYLERA